MDKHLVMSAKERRRKSLFDLVARKELSLQEASERLGVCYRQTRRSYSRYMNEGDAGLVHRGRGRASNRAKEAELRQAVLDEYRDRYAGFGPTFAAEKLSDTGYAVSHDTLRRWLLADGQWVKRRTRARHRSWRERKAHFGELVQMDGSPHRWFGADCEPACLMNMVDDACGVTMAAMSDQETTEAAMRLLWRWVERYGIPRALYTDRKDVYITERDPTVEEQLANTAPLTAFGRACQKLAIVIIAAHSPQAKGRVERKHGVYQDRFVKELALQGITTIEGANTLLLDGFVDGLNTRFARPPAGETDFHRPVPDGLNLADVFCWEQERVVQNDWTVRHANQRHQIAQSNRPLPRPKDKVLMRTRLDKTLAMLYRGKPLEYLLLPAEAVSSPTKAPAPRPAPLKQAATPKTANQTPWRQGCMMMAADSGKKGERQTLKESKAKGKHKRK